ncbi:hypothetical protein TNCV_563111 [Trichonephila clavipes]|nr:hypothetical protein TNCV_563111 [Trichonephila clavipes]
MCRFLQKSEIGQTIKLKGLKTVTANCLASSASTGDSPRHDREVAKFEKGLGEEMGHLAQIKAGFSGLAQLAGCKHAREMRYIG